MEILVMLIIKFLAVGLLVLGSMILAVNESDPLDIVVAIVTIIISIIVIIG